MVRAVVLGAGAMGSAFAAVLDRAGHEVRLWGTHLDTEIVEQLRAGEAHPRTHERLPSGVEVLDDLRLGEALQGAELVVVAIASIGVNAVVTRAAQLVATAPSAVLVLSKGFALAPSGQVELLTDAIRRILTANSIDAPIVGVGGPCKANEVAAGRPTNSVFASECFTAAAEAAAMVWTDDYYATASDDLVGVEVSAALKNLFAVALGMCDGLAALGGQPWHDLRAASFTQAVAEMGTVVRQLGGRAETVLGLAGLGDLEVTALSGRNRSFGERLGRGQTPRIAHEEMDGDGLTVEGLSVAGLVRQIVLERAAPGTLEATPLLELLTAALQREDEPVDAASLLRTVTNPGRRDRTALDRPGGTDHNTSEAARPAPGMDREPSRGHHEGRPQGLA